MIPYGKQNITQSDIESVVSVLKSDFITQGPKVPEFERAVADKVGARHALAVNSATSALHIACLALGLGAGDWLWTTPVTFVASANCGLYCGAKVDFVDIDPATYNLSVEDLEARLADAKRHNRLPKILVVAHLCGQSCQMEAIYKLSRLYRFCVIEDASHAIGGKYRGDYIGSCQYSDITVFSFHPVKIITTGEGGMVLTNRDELAQKMNLLRSHGVTRDPIMMTQEPDGPWYYQQVDLGFNYRMTDLQAALGISQLERLDQLVERRNELASRYDARLAELTVTLPVRIPETYSSLHLYVIRLNLNEMTKTHREVFEELRKLGVGVNLHYIPIHMQPYYKKLGFRKGDFPKAEEYYSTAISLPMFPDLSYEEQDFVVESLRKST